jgi:capsid assembly protease
MSLAHLAQRLFNVPLAIHPEKVEVIVAALAERLGVLSVNGLDPRAIMAREGDYFVTKEADNPRGGYEVVGGVAVIQVQGTLVNKLGTVKPCSGMTGYDGIRQNFVLAMDDPKVRAICFDVNSPGGEVAGCLDLCDLIFSARGVKPMRSILSENALSAAYAIASAAGHISVPRSGCVGSVGVIVAHADLSQVLAKEGIKVTLITHGARKADGRAEIPLSKEALASAQRQIDALGDMLDAMVSRDRKLSMAKVSAMEAGTFMGAEGVEQGLADAVAAPDAAFRSLVHQL